MFGKKKRENETLRWRYNVSNGNWNAYKSVPESLFFPSPVENRSQTIFDKKNLKK